jgi:hypothetical protein
MRKSNQLLATETQHPKDGIAEQTPCEERCPPGAVQQGVHSLKKSMPNANGTPAPKHLETTNVIPDRFLSPLP